ncbi:hypothetical protein ACROYT_G022139 [Oculina patagonica]
MVPKRYVLIFIAVSLLAQSLAIPVFPIQERELESLRRSFKLPPRTLCGLTSVKDCSRENSKVAVNRNMKLKRAQENDLDWYNSLDA